MHVGSTAIRLGPGSELCFLELDDRRVQVSLPRGLLNVRLRQQDPGESFQIDTPTMSVLILGPGSYRVEVREWGDTQATVNEGGGRPWSRAVLLHPRAPERVRRPVRLAVPRAGRAPAADEWDRWCAGRDSREDRLASVRYVPRSMVGCEDLDWYGNWNETSEYGPVWIPSSVPAGWAPYKFGRWAWVQPWGWTWIDEPAVGVRPLPLRPLGHFPRRLGLGAGFDPAPARVRAGAGGLRRSRPRRCDSEWEFRWFPLGPREAYVPPYQASREYIRKVNLRHVRIDDHQTIDPSKLRYAHRDQLHAYTVVAQQTFSHAHQVGDARVEIPDSDLKKTRVS